MDFAHVWLATYTLIPSQLLHLFEYCTPLHNILHSFHQNFISTVLKQHPVILNFLGFVKVCLFMKFGLTNNMVSIHLILSGTPSVWENINLLGFDHELINMWKYYDWKIISNFIWKLTITEDGVFREEFNWYRISRQNKNFRVVKK